MMNLRIQHTSGDVLEAPLGVWFVALFRTLSDEQQAEVFKHANGIHGSMIAALLSGRSGEQLAVNLTTEKKQILASNGKPSEVTVDKNGKKHHRIFLDPGSYTQTLKSLKGSVTGKEKVQ